jgi:hypothetical protein
LLSYSTRSVKGCRATRSLESRVSCGLGVPVPARQMGRSRPRGTRADLVPWPAGRSACVTSRLSQRLVNGASSRPSGTLRQSAPPERCLTLAVAT